MHKRSIHRPIRSEWRKKREECDDKMLVANKIRLNADLWLQYISCVHIVRVS